MSGDETVGATIPDDGAENDEVEYDEDDTENSEDAEARVGLEVGIRIGKGDTGETIT